MISTKVIARWFVLGLGLGIFSANFGCRTDPRPPAARFASVELQGNTPGQIAQVLVEVFRDDGYKVTEKHVTEFVFEKEGTHMNDLAYGGWMDPHVWIRVKASILSLAEGKYRLQCQAFLVRDRNEMLEEELKVKYRSGKYQKLVDEVASRLHGSTQPQ